MTAKKINYSANDSLREEILKAIEEYEDKALKVILLLMLKTLDAIEQKIDSVIRDEVFLKEIVLNGDASTHAEDHRKFREFWSEWGTYKSKINALSNRHGYDVYCDWAAKQMKKEEQEIKSFRTVRDGWLIHLAWGATTIIVSALAAKYLGGIF